MEKAFLSGRVIAFLNLVLSIAIPHLFHAQIKGEGIKKGEKSDHLLRQWHPFSFIKLKAFK